MPVKKWCLRFPSQKQKELIGQKWPSEKKQYLTMALTSLAIGRLITEEGVGKISNSWSFQVKLSKEPWFGFSLTNTEKGKQIVRKKSNIQMATNPFDASLGRTLKTEESGTKLSNHFLMLPKKRGHACGSQSPDTIRGAFTFQIWLESRIQSLEYWQTWLETFFSL